MVRDMTHGSPIRLIAGFWFPMLVGNLFQQVYSLVDSVIVGRYVGVDAFAGISATGSLNFLILGLLLGMCSGCAIPVAQAFGENNPHRMRKFYANAIYLCGGAAVVMSVATVLLARSILRWIGTPADIMDQAYSYIVYIFGGMTATMLYNLSSGVLRAVGNTRTPLYFLILSCAVNVGLDFLCVLGLGMGVTGAAVATVASQLLSGALCMRLIFKNYDVLRVHGEEWHLDMACMRRLCAIGLPMGLQFSITAIGSLIMQTAVNGLGSGAVAAIGAASKVYMVFCCPFDAIGATVATWCGQNLGAGRIDRVRVGARESLLVMSVYAAAMLFVTRALGRRLIGLFIPAVEAGVLANALEYLNTVVYFFMHPDYDDAGRMKAKTIGKMLDNQLTIEGMFPIVLLADRDDSGFHFVTQSDGTTPVKAPMGMFDEAKIDNDLKLVDSAIREYWQMKPLVGDGE